MSKEKKVDTEKLIILDLEKEKSENNKNDYKKPNWFKRKGRKIKKIFSEFWVLGKTGFLMGSFVGLTMGFLGGCMAAYQTKSLLVIPVSMIGSGFFFGSLMGIGACLRTSSEEYDKNGNPIYQKMYIIKNKEGKYITLYKNDFYNDKIYAKKSLIQSRH